MWSIELTLLITLICIYSKASGICSKSVSPKFSKFLTDQTVKTGQNALFACAVPKSEHETVIFSWHIRPDKHTKEITEHIFNDEEFESSLTIYDLDTSVFVSCVLQYQNQQGGRSQRCQIRSTATLLVEYFPAQNDLACTPSGPLEMRVGDILSVRCEVPRCEPAVDLTWKLRDQRNTLLPLPSTTDIGQMRVLSQEVEIDQFHHLNKIICLVTSEFAFPSQRLTCTIGPIKVLMRPSVDIYPSRINVSEGEYFQLNCLVNGYPKTYSFKWSCLPNNILHGCNSTRQNITLSVSGSFSAETVGITVRCTVTNSEGSGSRDAIVNVIPDDSPGTLCDETNCYSANLFITNDSDPCCLKASCSLLPTISSRGVEFQWIIDGQNIGPEDPAIRQVSVSTSSLTFKRNFDFNADSLATCQIKFDDGILMSSQNISKLLLNETSRSSTNLFQSKFRSDSFNPNDMISHIPFMNRTTKQNSSEQHTNAMEANNATARSENFQQSTIHLRKLVPIIIGAVFIFIIATAFSVTLMSILMYRYLNKRSKAMRLTELKVNDIGLNESHIGDTFYETADEPVDTFPNSLHTPSSSGSLTSFSDEYESNSSMYYAVDNGDCVQDCHI